MDVSAYFLPTSVWHILLTWMMLARDLAVLTKYVSIPEASLRLRHYSINKIVKGMIRLRKVSPCYCVLDQYDLLCVYCPVTINNDTDVNMKRLKEKTVNDFYEDMKKWNIYACGDCPSRSL
jgi:hypothetical protein